MGKQILQKIIAAIVASAVIVVLAVFSFPMLITGLQLSDGTLVTAETLFNVKGASSYFVLLFVVSVIVTLVTLLVGSNRRRRRSEEHTSELQSRPHLVCRLLLEKKNIN